jgi:uncharacterized repeat protein (TIGR01451 family)
VTVTDHADVKMNTPITANPTVVSWGQNITYTVTVTNLGPQSARNVTVTFTPPAGTTFVSSSGSSQAWWVCNGTSCAIPSDLGPGYSSNYLWFTVKAVSGCSYSTTVNVTANEIDSNPSNNSATTATVTVSPCDVTPPVVNVSFPAPTGRNGWFASSPVTGTVTATDAVSNVSGISCTGASLSGLSGIGTKNASGSLTVSVQGINNVTCTATDSAGNSGAASGSSNTATVKIDSVAPAVTVTPDRTPDQNGFYNHAVIFTFSGSDAISDGVTCSAPVTYNGPDNANASVSGSCTDNAGNTASVSLSFAFDASAPVITGTRTPEANVHGWNNTDVTVSFTCTDELSGVASVSGPTTLSAEGAGQSVTGTCTDKSGNSAILTVEQINIDKTAPSISGSRSPLANANGWNNTNVTVSFTCSDSLSGLDVGSPPADTMLTAEGAGQSATGTCTDKAGNSASATVGGINIDKTPPAITITAPTNGGTYTLNQPVASNYGCTDALSGVASCTGPVASGANSNTGTIGSITFTVTATDKAGNTASSSSTYSINFAFLGLLAPWTPPPTTFKAGSTVPLKFQFCDASGNCAVGANANPQLQIFNDNNCDKTADSSTPIDLGTISSGSSTLRFDTTANQWIFNFQTPKVSTAACYIINITGSDNVLRGPFNLKTVSSK